MSPDTVTAIAAWLVKSGLLGPQLSVLWHAGEPLAIPVATYRELMDTLERELGGICRLRYRIQTNGILINADWCDFLLKNDIDVGISLDGPDFVHDFARKRRSAESTHSLVMRGVRLLQETGVKFRALVTVTSTVLQHRDAVLSFLQEAGIKDVAFNVETVLGIYETSTVSIHDLRDLRELLSDALSLHLSARMNVREFTKTAWRLKNPKQTASDLSTPGAVITIDTQGNASFFSPELLGHSSPLYGDFAIGNVREKSYAEMIASERFQRIAEDIQRGVETCRSECGYFPFCGGASPANKYFENGTFRSTETSFCRFHIQLPTDLILERQAPSTA